MADSTFKSNEIRLPYPFKPCLALAIRHQWPPISISAGDVIQFPGSWHGNSDESETQKQEEKGSVISIKRWVMLHFGTDVLGFYDSRPKAEGALKAIMQEFVSGEGTGRTDSKGVLEDAVNEDIFFGVVDILRERGIINDVGIDDSDELLHTDLQNNKHQVFVDTTLDFYSEDAWAPLRHTLAKNGLGLLDMPLGFEPPESSIMEHEPTILLDLNLDRLPRGIWQKMLPSDTRIQKVIASIIKTIVELIRRKLRHKSV